MCQQFFSGFMIVREKAVGSSRIVKTQLRAWIYLPLTISAIACPPSNPGSPANKTARRLLID